MFCILNKKINSSILDFLDTMSFCLDKANIMSYYIDYFTNYLLNLSLLAASGNSGWWATHIHAEFAVCITNNNAKTFKHFITPFPKIFFTFMSLSSYFLASYTDFQNI